MAQEHSVHDQSAHDHSAHDVARPSKTLEGPP
jgi:hypothetical protein